MFCLLAVLFMIDETEPGRVQGPASGRSPAAKLFNSAVICFMGLVSCFYVVQCACHACCAGVTINTYRVIYNLIDDVKAAMEGKLRQVEEKLPLGTATVSAKLATIRENGNDSVDLVLVLL